MRTVERRKSTETYLIEVVEFEPVLKDELGIRGRVRIVEETKLVGQGVVVTQ
jgi:hypothetical protein